MFSRLAPRVLPRASTSSKLSLSASPFVRPSALSLRPTVPSSSLLGRCYSDEGPVNDQRLTVKNVEIRILDIFRTFDKVNQDNVSIISRTSEQGERREEEEEEEEGRRRRRSPSR